MKTTIEHTTTGRKDRRAQRTFAQRRRWGRASALLCLAGIALLVPSFFFVQVGGAVGSVTASPNTGLTDGATITVSWTGLRPNFSPVIEQCNAAPTNPTTDCDFLTLVVSDSNASGAGSDTFTTFAGSGPSHLFACDDQHACTIRVADDPNDLTTGAVAALTFSTAATTTSSTSTSSTSSTSSSSTSSTSATSSTSSTTTPDGSTTSSTAPTDVLGTDASNSGGGTSGSDGLVLAFTGTALHLPYTLFAGALLFMLGIALRRMSVATA